MRTLAIGDIHGCLHHLNDLLAIVKPTPEDLLVTLGDYVDRGADSRGVLDALIRMKASGTKLVCLRGNHELLMLDARKGGSSELKMWQSVGGVQTLGSYGSALGKSGTLGDVPEEHWKFLETALVDYFETERFLFAHATVACDRDMHEQSADALFWDYVHHADAMRHRSGKTLICGHTSQRSGVPLVVPGAVCIDTFAAGGGWLTCLDVESGRYWQVNALGKSREGQLEYRS